MNFEFSSFGDFEASQENLEIKKVKKFQRLWNYGKGGSICQITVNDGISVFGACDSYIYCVEPNGALRWKFKTDDIIMGSPKIVEDTVFCGSYDYAMYAINLPTGEEIWRFRTGGEIFSEPAYSDGKIYFGSRDGYLYCLDAKNGIELWKFKTGNDIAFCPVVYENKVIVGSYDSILYCLDKNDGNELWRFKTGDQIQMTTPSRVYDNVFYFASFDNYLYAVRVEDGLELWRFKMGNYGSSGAAFVYNNTIYQGDREGYIYALAIDGREKWRFNTGKLIVDAVAFENKIYFGSEDGYLYCLDEEGNELWRFKSDGPIYGVRIDDKRKRIFFGGWDCHLYSIDAVTGEQLWNSITSTKSQSYAPPANDVFEAVVKKSGNIDETINNEEKYNIATEHLNLSDYGAKSEYAGSSEYAGHSEYATDFAILTSCPDRVHAYDFWILHCRCSYLLGVLDQVQTVALSNAHIVEASHKSTHISEGCMNIGIEEMFINSKERVWNGF